MGSPGGALYWQKCIEGMHSFVNSMDKTTLEIVPVSPSMVKDSFLRLRKKVGLTEDLVTPRKGFECGARRRS